MIKTKKTAIYIKLTSFDAEIGASKKKSHNKQNEWAIPIGIAHFLNKQKYISKFTGEIYMVGRIYHVGLTVSDLERSIAFYRDVLGLEFQGEIFMEGEETDKMFRRVNCKARVAYLNGSKAVEAPPVELIQFVNNEVKKVPSDLFTTSISEVCFYTDDIDSAYKHLVDNNVECLSEPQYFDFRADGFGESRAFYFRDPDGIILEMMQPL